MSRFSDDDTLPLGTVSAKAGKITLHRSPMGRVWFIDHKGISRNVDNPNLATALYETAKQGKGAAITTQVKQGDQPANLHYRGEYTFKPPM